MDVLALIIAVVLIIYLMQVGFPRPTRQRSAPRTFLYFYLHRIFASWVILAVPGIILLHDSIPLSRIGLLLPNPWWPTVLAFIAVFILFSLLLVSYLRAMSDKQLVARQAQKRNRLALPRTLSERVAWVGVSINAGIWEEIVFRGFLPWYLVHHLTMFGFSIPFFWAAVISLILFSLGHLYQGWGGVLGVGLLGITLAVLYALTGNLLASILWHILFDVRFSFGTPTPAGTTPPHAVEASPDGVDGGEPRPGAGIWHSRQQRRRSLQINWKEQPHVQECEEPKELDASKMIAEGETPPIGEKLKGESESVESVQLGVRTGISEGKEITHTDVSTIASERPARGRAAREQLLHDMGE